MSSRASTAYLERGSTSIDRAAASKVDDKWVIHWRVRLHDGRLVNRRSQGATQSEARRRARAKAKQMLSAGAGSGSWTPRSSLAEFVEKVSRPAFESARKRTGKPLARKTLDAYRTAASHLVGECREPHRHQHSLQGYSIADGTAFQVLKDCLREIARLHGSGAARHAKVVLGKFVIDELLERDLIAHNPLLGRKIDLHSDLTASRPSGGGKALTEAEYHRVLDYLLAMDAEGESYPAQRGTWTRANQIAKRRNTIDLALLQATTGLRVIEAVGITWRDVTLDDEGNMLIHVSQDLAKTDKARTAPVLDSRVTARLIARQDASQSMDEFVIGAPSDPAKRWDRDNAGKAAKQLYLGVAEATDVPLLAQPKVSTHVWRATLNTIFIVDLPEVIRSAHFGHTAQVNRSSYTDLSGIHETIQAASTRRAARSKSSAKGSAQPGGNEVIP